MSKNTEKKKKPFWKRLLKWTGISFVVIFIILLLIPILFKDQIIQLIKDEANSSLNAELDFGDADLTFISTFPNLTLTIKDISLKGKDDFSDIYLAKINTTTLKLDFWSALFGDQFEIQEVYLEEPILHIKVLENGKANYDIAIADTTQTESTEPTSAFKLSLNYYKIKDGDITYDDAYYLTYIHLPKMNHSGNIKIDDVIYTIDTETKSDGLTFGYDGFNYLSNSVADINCELEIAMPESEMKLTFKKNEAIINALKLHFDGDMLMKDDFMDFNFTFNTLDQTFSSLLSIVPGVFTEDFGSIKTDGDIELSGSLNGKYSETDMPGFDLTTKISNAYLQYPDLPSKLEKINLDLNISREEGPDLNNLLVDLKKLSLEFLENKIDATLFLSNIMKDPNIKSNLKTYVNLSQIGNVIPLSEGESYSGIVTSDINLKGKLSSIENEKYDEFDANGELKIEEMNYASTSLNYPVSISEMLFKFSPESLNLVTFDSKIGNSDLHSEGVLSNYLAYFLKDETLEGALKVHSNYLDLDQLMYEDAENVSTTSTNETTITQDSIPAEVFQIPENINFSLATTISKMKYDSLELKNVVGNIQLKEGVASLKEIKMDIFDGNIKLNGDYRALNPKRAKIDFAYDINNLDFKQAFNYFNTVQKYASIAQYCNGKFSTSMTIEAELDENYSPIYESISGLGDFKSSQVKLDNIPLLEKATQLIKIKELKNQTLQNLNLSYEFKEGKIWVKETPIKLGKIDSKLSGTTSFTQELDYVWDAILPSEMFGNNANEIANNLLSLLNDKTGTNVSVPKNIPVKFNIGGTITNPTLVSNLKQTAEDTKQDLIDQGTQIIKDKLSEQAKKILEDAQKEADKLIAQAKAQADALRTESENAAKKIEEEADNLQKKAKEETQKQADKLKKEGYDAAQKLIDNAKNPLEKIAAEKAAEKLRQETDKKVETLLNNANKTTDDAHKSSYDKAKKVRDEGNTKANTIENTAQSQADNIMNNANAQVDKLK